ncbi:MAG: hypothetical protein JST10_04135 [Bacteroidetes bacterium]|nr:hypothetical protein [Bacteroidota bacterium]MBS1631746.1 hypothetical protein [Bacteroidota bacterium]
MKKILLSLAMFVTLGTMSAFADTAEVNPRVISSFKNDFSGAKEAAWYTGTDYFKVAFTFNGNHVYAFYNSDGELLGITRYISSLDLPMNLQRELKKKYSEYWISDLFELANDNGTGYYITLENADTKIILNASANSDWKNYSKVNKN